MYHNYFFFSSLNSEPDYKVRKTQKQLQCPNNPHKVSFQADDISHNMIYMDQKGEKQRPATGRGRGVNVQRIRVSPGQDTEVSVGVLR